MTGWKLNPVNFDSVFNRSKHTWSWGSPDILPMFSTGAVPGRVDIEMYGAEAEDFTQDAVMLDEWVFERVKRLFKEDASKNETLDKELREQGNVFFLHLLGLDTTGHAFRPYSKEYLHNIKVVDEGVKEITEMIEEFYGDGKTAFVFTADHGMSDWGSHGDGHPDNTRTPLIAWGAGVAKPNITATRRSKKGPNIKAPGHEDGLSADWGLDHIQRHDVAQADVAALMAYLAGLNFPVNSVGELPLNYLDATPKAKAEALLVNAQQILEMYRVKEEQKAAHELRYIPYGALGDEEHSVEHRVQTIQNAIDAGQYEKSIKSSEELIKHGLEGLRYLQTYDWLFLRLLVTAGYLGWIAFAVTLIIDMHVLRSETPAVRTRASNTVFSSILVVLYSVLLVQRSSWRYYFYGVFPVMFWEEVYARRGALAKGKEMLLGHMEGKGEWMRSLAKAAAYLALLEALVSLP
jgi:GPI ethanolamine phosphate transferase 1